MLYLKYRDREINQNLYALEYFIDGELIVEYFDDYYAYPRALIRAFDLQIDGLLVYCITRNRQKIISGMPVKRGVKPKNKDQNKIYNPLTPQLPAAPENMV